MAKEKGNGAVFATIQKVGRSFFLPVSILPIAGLLLGLGASFTNETTIEAYNLSSVLGDGTILHGLLTIMSQVGDVIFGNLPIIFAMAVALGMAKNEKAVAVLASAVSFFVMNTTINGMLKITGQITSDGTVADGVLAGTITSVCGIQSLQMGVFGGIIVGLGVAALHNRFYKQKLPAALSFFAGVRFVPIISVVVYLVVGIVCFFAWPVVQNGIYAAGGLVTNSGYAGTFIFGVLERALIPFGLHHVFYMPFWQTGLGGTAVIDGIQVAGAQNIYFAELASPTVTHFSVEASRFMTGKFTVMMGGLPGAALAMYRCSKPENRKVVGGLLVSAAMTSFLTGVTEPIEFTFLFIAPALFAIHCVLAGVGFLVCHLLDICIGTTFSCGLIDFILYGPLQGNGKTNWILMVPVLVIYVVVYYFLFSWVIKKFNLKTPGREDGDGEIKLFSKADFQKKVGKQGAAGAEVSFTQEDIQSATILKGLGGLANVEDVDCCATRLRVTVRDAALVDDATLKSTGTKGIVKKGAGIQVIYGPHVAIIKSDLEEYIDKIKGGEIKEETLLQMISGEAEEVKPEETSGKDQAVYNGPTKILAAADGQVIPMTEVTDEGFSSCAMGNGVAIQPENGIVVAPADGEISVVMPGSNHAVGLTLADGFDLLVHVGVDTVSLNGEGFTAFVEAGQKVKAGDKLIEFDKNLVVSKGLSPDVIMIFMDSDELPEFDYKPGVKAIAGETVIAEKK